MSTTEELLQILEGDVDEGGDYEFVEDEVFFGNITETIGPEFTWSSQGTQPIVEPFDDFISGVSQEIQLNRDSSVLDFYEHFVDRELIEGIVKYTNQYHQQFIRNTDLRTYSRLHRWTDVTVSEIYLSLALMMLMTRNCHLTIEEHWSTNPLLSSPIFGQVMARNRYCMILGMLCFEDLTAQESSSRLKKVQFVIDHARMKYKKTLVPHAKLCIDESIVPFKGRLIFKQYLPNKRNRFGIKLFVLCDVYTGYILDFIVYTGSSTEVADIEGLGKSGSVVAKLVEDYSNCHRKLYVDNWYSSPSLFRYLHEKKIYACGTVKTSRLGMPTFKKVKKGEVDVHYCSNLMAMRWRDKKNVHMLSTIHDGVIIPTEKLDRSTGLPKMKPACVEDYSKNMGSVDTADMMMSSLTFLRKTIKWNKKLALHVFDMHLLNAFKLYKIVKSEEIIDFAQFQLRVVDELLQKYKPAFSEPGPSIITQRRNTCDFLRILSGDAAEHMPKLIPGRKSQRCKVCQARIKRSQTRYHCSKCNVFLCVDPCFQIYHKDKTIGASQIPNSSTSN